jgi:hypothetical protein
MFIISCDIFENTVDSDPDRQASDADPDPYTVKLLIVSYWQALGEAGM